MAEYRMIWVRDYVMTGQGEMLVDVPNATHVLNEWCNAGYEVVAMVPGTNAQTHTGMFIAFRKG
ncbi:hypothetical protein StoSoilA2_11650 [Arthrobacter sp. StoSoilA2]|uniref:hypothetical protein n=1 Tax=Paenarthrobacter sp. YIM B13468 TaxID=3366295 RepID=UPI001E741C5E|nr:hypothetical protein StoSoilA2_11650 [Arthrobacter sp. StoSoilA2]